MKTVMQMVLDKFDKMPQDVFLTYLKVNREGILEKEKEQIIEAYAFGADDVGFDGEISERGLRDGKYYYKETYQNK